MQTGIELRSEISTTIWTLKAKKKSHEKKKMCRMLNRHLPDGFKGWFDFGLAWTDPLPAVKKFLAGTGGGRCSTDAAFCDLAWAISSTRRWMCFSYESRIFFSRISADPTSFMSVVSAAILRCSRTTPPLAFWISSVSSAQGKNLLFNQ